jgi:protein-disulfide isomerase
VAQALVENFADAEVGAVSGELVLDRGEDGSGTGLGMYWRYESAIKAAESAECANRQGKFWEMHDALFTGGADLSDASVRATARRVGLVEEHFGACLAGQATERIRQDLADAAALGIVGTPTFFLGTIQPDGRVKVTQVLSGNHGMTEFQAALDKLLDAPQRAER